MTELLQDLRYAIRVLAKSPGFTAVALLTLALGIGASTAMFSITNSVLLEPLPYRDAGRLVAISESDKTRGLAGVPISYTRLQEVRAQSRSLEALGAYFVNTGSLSTSGSPELVNTAVTTSDLFTTLGIVPEAGRNFTTQEEGPGGANVAIISDSFWHNHFGGRHDIVGQTLNLDGKSQAIIGVLPASFEFPFTQPVPDVWLPRIFEVPFLKPVQVYSGAGFLTLYAKLPIGMTRESVARELATIDKTYKAEHQGFADTFPGLTMDVVPLKESIVGPIRTPLLVLLSAVGFLLLIGCTNLASLLLSRATARRKEIAIRTALGASRRRLVRQLLTETLLLSFAGGVLGVAVAKWSLPALRLLPPGTLPRIAEIYVDARALLVALGLCVVTGVAFGLVPSLQISNNKLQDALKESSRGSSSGGRAGRSRATLVVIEVAAAMVLICTAGLLLKSFNKLIAVDPGFDPHNVMSFGVNLPPARYATPQSKTEFYRRLAESVSAIPHVSSVGVVSYLPVGGGSRLSYICPQGMVCQGIGKDPLAAMREISPDYFKTMRISLLRGRAFSDHDNANSQNVAIVNDTFAKQFFDGEDPVGKHVMQDRGNIQCEIVGVVSSVHFFGLATPFLPELYLPQEQSPIAFMSVVARSDSDSQALTGALRAAVGKLDSDMPLTNLLSMDDVLSASVAQPRLISGLTAAFSVLTLAIAAIGIYGVMAFSVAQRKQEIAIRMAMGATPGGIAKLMARQGLQLVIVGIVLGLAGALAFTRVLQSILFQLSAHDPLTFAGVTLILVAVAVVACYVPARRAMRVDPIIALRVD